MIKKLSVRAAAMMAVGLSMSTAAADPESYTLVCRGSNDTRIMVNHDVDGAGVPGATAMTVFFRQGATADNPGAGECVWQDRAMGGSEPATIWIKSPRVEFAFQVTGDGRVASDGSGLRLSAEGTNASAEAKDWQYIVDAVTQGNSFKVKAYNQGGSVMVITDVMRP